MATQHTTPVKAPGAVTRRADGTVTQDLGGVVINISSRTPAEKTAAEALRATEAKITTQTAAVAAQALLVLYERAYLLLSGAEQDALETVRAACLRVAGEPTAHDELAARLAKAGS